MGRGASKTWLTIFAAVLLPASDARAEPTCGPTVSRGDIARCAATASLEVKVEERARDAIEGRRRAATALLRTNPVLAVSAARRNTDAQSATNWSATLSQEIEIAGQRGARLRATEYEGEAQRYRIDVARREALAAAWTAYFDVLARGEDQRLLTRLSVNAAEVAIVARAMADKGLLAPIDADVADAGAVTTEQARIEAEQHARQASLALATMLGLDASRPLDVRGDLLPLVGVANEARPKTRPELLAFAAERRAQEATASAYTRARIPSPTLSLFVQNDGFNERVLGGGLSFPIPLPYPVVRHFNGEIAEAKALAERAGVEGERARRHAELALGTALSEYEGARARQALFTDERVTRAERDIEVLAKELQAGRLAIRDALVTQQALVTLLRASVAARYALCAASVELARAANLPLDRGGR